MKSPRLLFAVVVVGLLVWGRLLYAGFSNAPPPRQLSYFDENGHAVEKEACRDPIVVDGPRLWLLCGRDAQPRLGRVDLDRGRVDLSVPLRGYGSLGGFFRVGDDAYLIVQTPSTVIYRVGKDGRLESLGEIDDTPNGIGWATDHLEVVTGKVLPMVYARQGNEWKKRPITYRDNDYRRRAFEVAYRDGTDWKFVVSRFPEKSPANEPVKVDIELGDESGNWQTTQQVEIPWNAVLHLSDGSIEPYRPIIERTAGSLIGWSHEQNLPYTFVNGHVEPSKPPVAASPWGENVHWDGNSLFSLAHTSLTNTLTRIGGRWLAVEDEAGTVVRELATGRRSPRAIAPLGSFKLLPDGNGYALLDPFQGTYARIDADFKRTDAPNLVARLRDVDVPLSQKLLFGIACLGPLAPLALRRSRLFAPMSVAYLLAVIVGLWAILPVFARL